MGVTAPMAASRRLTSACLIRCVEITGRMICNTGPSSSECAAKWLWGGENATKYWRNGKCGMTPSTSQAGVYALRRAPHERQVPRR